MAGIILFVASTAITVNTTTVVAADRRGLGGSGSGCSRSRIGVPDRRSGAEMPAS